MIARFWIYQGRFTALKFDLATDKVFESWLVLFDELDEDFQTCGRDLPFFSGILVGTRVEAKENCVDYEMEVRIETGISLTDTEKSGYWKIRQGVQEFEHCAG